MLAMIPQIINDVMNENKTRGHLQPGPTANPLTTFLSPSQCVSSTCSQMETRWLTPIHTSRPAASFLNWSSGRGFNVSVPPMLKYDMMNILHVCLLCIIIYIFGPHPHRARDKSCTQRLLALFWTAYPARYLWQVTTPSIYQLMRCVIWTSLTWHVLDVSYTHINALDSNDGLTITPLQKPDDLFIGIRCAGAVTGLKHARQGVLRTRCVKACCCLMSLFVCVGSPPCPWQWNRPEFAGSCSQLRAEAAICSDWPSAVRLCHNSSHTCCTHQDSWRSVLLWYRSVYLFI